MQATNKNTTCGNLYLAPCDRTAIAPTKIGQKMGLITHHLPTTLSHMSTPPVVLHAVVTHCGTLFVHTSCILISSLELIAEQNMFSHLGVSSIDQYIKKYHLENLVVLTSESNIRKHKRSISGYKVCLMLLSDVIVL